MEENKKKATVSKPKILLIIIISLILIYFVYTLANYIQNCIENYKQDQEEIRIEEQIKFEVEKNMKKDQPQIISKLNEYGITECTFSYEIEDNEIDIKESYITPHIIVDIPALDRLDDNQKVEILNHIIYSFDSRTFEVDGRQYSSCTYVDYTSNGNQYRCCAYEEYLKAYVRNHEKIYVVGHENINKNEDSGNYNKNDSYYSNNDYNNDGYLNGNEFQGAVGDWMDAHGY